MPVTDTARWGAELGASHAVVGNTKQKNCSDSSIARSTVVIAVETLLSYA